MIAHQLIMQNRGNNLVKQAIYMQFWQKYLQARAFRQP